MKRLFLILSFLFLSTAAFADTAILQSADGNAISASNPLQVTVVGGGGSIAAGLDLTVINPNGYQYNDVNTSSGGTALQTVNGKQYAVYYNSGNYLTFSQRTTGSNTWTTTVMDGTGGQPTLNKGANMSVEYTNAMGFDKNGYIHVVYATYDSPLLYRKFATAYDTTSVLGASGSMLGTNETTVSFPMFFNDSVGDLYFIFRASSTTYYMYKYNSDTTTWEAAPGTSTAGLFINTDSAQISTPYLDSDGNFRIVWTWSGGVCDTASIAGNNSCKVTYVKYNPNTGAFTKASGSAQTIPATYSNTSGVGSSNLEVEGMPANRSVYGDSAGNIYVAFAQSDANGRNQLYFTKLSAGGTTWATPVQLTNGADNRVLSVATAGSYLEPSLVKKFPTVLVDSSDNIYVIYKEITSCPGLLAQKSTDGGATWKQFAIYSGAIGYGRPINIDINAWRNTGEYYNLLQFVFQRVNVTSSVSPIYLLHWNPSEGSYQSQTSSYGLANQNDIQLFSEYGNIVLNPVNGAVKIAPLNIHYISTSVTLDTAIANATTGDVIVLGNGTWTVTDNVNISKSLTIVGQGPGRTIINTTTGSLSGIFNVTTSNVTIANLSITSTGAGTQRAIYFNGASGSVKTNNVVDNVAITMSAAGTQIGVQYDDASGTVRKLNSSITSSDGLAQNLKISGLSTAEAAITLNVYDSECIVSTGGSTNSYCYYAQDSTSPSTVTMNLYNSKGTVTESASATSRAVYSGAGSDAVLNVYGGSFSGTDADIEQGNSATLNVYNANLVNNRITGTITYPGYRFGGAVVGKTATSTNTVKTGANTACNTTCAGSQCSFGVDDTNKLPLACTDATADTCVCMGP